MKVDENHPGLVKYRAARAAKREKAVARKEIMDNNPELSMQQADAIYEAQKRAQAAKKAEKKKKKTKQSRKPNFAPKNKKPKIKPEVVVLPSIKQA